MNYLKVNPQKYYWQHLQIFCILKSVHSGTLEVVNILVDPGFTLANVLAESRGSNLFCDAFWKRGKTPEGKCTDSFNTFYGMRIGVMTFMETSWRTFECMARTCRVVWRLYLWPHNFGFLELELGPIKGCAIQIWVWAKLKRTSRFQDLRGCGISIGWYCSVQQSFTEHLLFLRHWGYKHVTLSLNSSGQSLGEGRTGGSIQFSRCCGGGRYRVLWEKRGHIT